MRRALIALVLTLVSQSTPAAQFDIRIQQQPAGVSRLQAGDDGGRVWWSTSLLSGALLQRDQLHVDGGGWPSRYALQAMVQGQPTTLTLQRDDQGWTETVTQHGATRTSRLDAPHQADLVDNNSLAGWQAWLDRIDGLPRADTDTTVIVPQAQQTGRLHVEQSTLASVTLDGKARTVRSIDLTLTVAGTTVPVTLWLDPRTHALLRYRQRDSKATFQSRAGEAPAADSCTVRTRELSITDGTQPTHGTWTAPATREPGSPVLVIAPASGALDAAPVTAGQIARRLATGLACAGIASLRFDDPDLAAAPLQTIAPLLAAALTTAARQPGVDPSRLFLGGHGDGALAALHAASGLNPRPAGLLLLAPPAPDMAAALGWRLRADGQLSGATGKTLAALTLALGDITRSLAAGTSLSPAPDGWDARLMPLRQRLRGELAVDAKAQLAHFNGPVLIVDAADAHAVAAWAAAAKHGAVYTSAAMTHALCHAAVPAILDDCAAPAAPLPPATALAIARWAIRVSGSRH